MLQACLPPADGTTGQLGQLAAAPLHPLIALALLLSNSNSESPPPLPSPSPCPSAPRRDAYLPGVQALFRSVRRTGSTYPFIVLYTAGKRGVFLSSFGWSFLAELDSFHDVWAPAGLG